MRLIALRVRNFRGISGLDWAVDQRLVCLVGSGDAGKTTVLDAIEWALCPRPSVPVSDADFHGLNVDEPIVIEATVGDVPPELLTYNALGVYARYHCTREGFHDEPDHPDDERVLTVRLSIDATLDPQWNVICGDRQEPQPIWLGQRRALGVNRLDGETGRHLRWGRGSALERLTESSGGAKPALAAAYRAARAGVDQDDLVALLDAVKTAREVASSYGAAVDPDLLHAAIDAASFSHTAGALGLHIDDVPLAASGLGTRRLLALALQAASVRTGAIMLVDEVEAGLEPHRLRHLLQRLETVIHAEEAKGSPRPGQVIMTTHSPVAVVELSAKNVHVTRRDHAGLTTLRVASDDLQGVIRQHPEALLARSVIVGEGATENGLVRGLGAVWAEESQPFANRGVAIANGGGNTKAPLAAVRLAKLGFRTALLVDGDKPINPDATAVQAAGVLLLQWADQMNTEQRLATDLPMGALIRLLDLVATELGHAQVRGDVAAKLGVDDADGLPERIKDWGAHVGEATLRKAIADAMSDCSYIKRIDIAEEVGTVVGNVLVDMSGTDLAEKISRLREWCFGS